jgi:hypothetical protein
MGSFEDVLVCVFVPLFELVRGAMTRELHAVVLSQSPFSVNNTSSTGAWCLFTTTADRGYSH